LGDPMGPERGAGGPMGHLRGDKRGASCTAVPGADWRVTQTSFRAAFAGSDGTCHSVRLMWGEGFSNPKEALVQLLPRRIDSMQSICPR